MKKILKNILKHHFLFLLISSIYLIFCLGLNYVFDIKARIIPTTIAFFLTYSVIYAICYMVFCLAIIRPARPVSYIIEKLKKAGPERIISFFLAILVISIIMICFKSVKPLIPVINPFCWDRAFAKLDNFLHGADPWRILHSYLSPPWITKILVFVYVSYFYAIFIVAGFQAAAPIESKKRMQFLLTFVLSWILLGNVTATIFSSAGPCYYSNVTNESKYAELISYLHDPSTPDKVIVNSQEGLWSYYQNRVFGQLFAISAMPSMHVSLMFLIFLAANHYITKILAILLTFMVSLGCIHFGWHYAVDIYAAIIGTYLIWFLTGIYVRRLSAYKAP